MTDERAGTTYICNDCKKQWDWNDDRCPDCGSGNTRALGVKIGFGKLKSHPTMPDERKQAEEINALLLEWELYKKAHWYKSDAIDVEAFLMDEFARMKAYLRVDEMPTEEEIQYQGDQHSSFIGVGGLKNNNIAKQTSFMQGARWVCEWFRNRMTSTEKPNNCTGGEG